VNKSVTMTAATTPIPRITCARSRIAPIQWPFLYASLATTRYCLTLEAIQTTAPDF
jgi:hypothetical protein